MLFLEKYIETYADIDSVNQCWNYFQIFVKECIISSSTVNKNLYFPILRIVTAILEKIDVTSNTDEKKGKRESDSIYQSICETIIAQIVKPSELNLSDISLDNLTLISDDDLYKVYMPSYMIIPNRIAHYFASKIIPGLRRLIQDQERILSIATNLVYYVIGPGLKTSPGSHPALSILSSLSKIPFSLKVWKREAWEAFSDAKFFNIDEKSCLLWKGLVNTLVSSEKELKIGELLGSFEYIFIT